MSGIPLSCDNAAYYTIIGADVDGVRNEVEGAVFTYDFTRFDVEKILPMDDGG
jgi:hypothetical protein